MPSDPNKNYLDQAAEHLKSFKAICRTNNLVVTEANKELVWAIDCLIRDRQIEELQRKAHEEKLSEKIAEPPHNRFADAKTMRELLLQVVEAGSVLSWTSIYNNTGFDSDNAKRIADDAMQRLVQIWGNENES